VNTRSTALYVLAFIAVIFALQQAREVLLPVVLAALISFALSPVVGRLHVWKIPRSLSAGILLTAIVGLLGLSVYAFEDQLTDIVNRLPKGAQNLRQLFRDEVSGRSGPIQKMQEAAHEIEKAAKEATGALAARSPAPSPPAAESPFNLEAYLWSGSLGALVLITQIVIVLFLAYFLLVSGDLFKRKLVKITGSALADKKVTVEILDQIDTQIGTFLLLQLLISVFVGGASWLVLAWIGVDHAGAWGLVNAFATLIPYFGPAAVTILMVVVGFLQFGTIGQAIFIGAVLTAIRTLEGMLLVPWLTGRVAHMNAVAVFVALLFWGWVWGAWGLLLAVPIMMACKVVCDHFESLKAIGEFLGE
jgi:predicted PurR-regulated permease PerM